MVSDWQDRGGWLELSGGSNVGDSGTAVLRLQDYSITNELIKVSGYAPDGTTVKIVSSPNDLTRLAVDSDGFAPEVVPIDSQLNYTKILFYGDTNRNSRTIQQPITHDLFECVPGRSDTYINRGFRCHSFAYPSFPAEVYTDFYAKDCDDAVETKSVRYRVSRNNYVTVNILGDVDAGYTRGSYNGSGVNSEDFERWYASSLRTEPEIECGPKTDGYHHVTKIAQNQTVSYSATYRFGPDDGVSSRGDLLQEIHGNVSLNTGNHDVHFEGTGLFEETVDLQRQSTLITEVIVDLGITGRYGSVMLESPDGQQQTVCAYICNNVEYTVVFDQTDYRGDWKLYGKATIYPHIYSPAMRLTDWQLTIGSTEYPERTFSPSLTPPSWSVWTEADSITIPDIGSLTQYRGDLYLVATGMNMTNGTAMVRAVESPIPNSPIIIDDPSHWIIHNMPSAAPYVITTVDGDLIKAGMSDAHGTINVPRDEMHIIPAKPVLLEYWPNSLTYAGNAHASGQGILFDQYNEEAVEFPWKADDPLLYVAKAYVKLTIPVDGTSLDGARLANGDGYYVSYPYLVKTYDAGNEVYIPVYPAAQAIRLQINGAWVQSYIKDVQQNTQAYVFSGTDAIDTSLGGLSGYNSQPTAAGTMIATQDGGVIAVISATAGGGAVYTVSADARDGRHSSAYSLCRSNYGFQCSFSVGLSKACGDWSSYLSANGVGYQSGTIGSTSNYKGNPGIFASIYHNGELVKTVSGVGSGGEGTSTKTGSQGSTSCYIDWEGQSYMHSGYSYFNGWGRYWPDAHIVSENPWRSNYQVDTSFTGATFSETLVLENVKISDQIDFVVSVGIPGLYGEDKPVLLVGNYSNIGAHSKGNMHLENGYILLYQ